MRRLLPFDFLIFQRTETLLNLRDVHVFSPGLLALTGRLRELFGGIDRGRHFGDS